MLRLKLNTSFFVQEINPENKPAKDISKNSKEWQSIIKKRISENFYEKDFVKRNIVEKVLLEIDFKLKK